MRGLSKQAPQGMLCPNGYMDIGSKDRLALHVRTPPNLLFELVLVAGMIGFS